MAVARSRTRKPSKPRQPRNPFVALGVAVGLVGFLMVCIAGYWVFTRSLKRKENIKMKRGLDLLEQLVPIACDYYYTGKDKENNGHLPDAVWAPLKKHIEESEDVFDAVITLSQGATDPYADACLYKEGKSAAGQVIRVAMGKNWYHGRPGPPPNPEMGQVQIIEGSVTIGSVTEKVYFFRRPILDQKKGTGAWHGRAMIILFRDRSSPETTPLLVPYPSASGDKPSPPEDKKPEKESD